MRLAAALVLSLVALPAWARTPILCRAQGAQGQGDVVVSLQDRTAFGRTLDCVTGPFVADVTPCAPLGGYGLSAAGMGAALVGIAYRRQDAMRNPGGVTGHYATAMMISFSSGRVGPGGYQDAWTFTVNRMTGAGRLEERGKPPVSYACDRAAARF